MLNAISLNETIKETNALKLVTHIADRENETTHDQGCETISLYVNVTDQNSARLMKYLRSGNLKLVFTIEEERPPIRIFKEKPLTKKTSGIIELSVKNSLIFVKPKDIIRMEASGSYTVFYFTNSSKETVSKNLKACEPLLKPSYFYRCHSSHIINLHQVVKLDTKNGLFIHMSDGSVIELSRRRKDLFLDRIKGI